jgi:predicted P-loop ATPase
MVRRIRKPGVKHDEATIFISAGGLDKSGMLAALAPDPAWFNDTIKLGEESKELVLSLAGVCLVEIAEMDARTAATNKRQKAMISRQIDSGRTAYSRAVSKRPRRNIFAITCNEIKPLTDPTGNRRFLPVHLERGVDMEWIHANRDQLIGEAAAREAKGETFRIRKELWAIAAERQNAAREPSDMETLLEYYFGEDADTAFAYVIAADLSMLATASRWPANNSTRSDKMDKLGFREMRIGARQHRAWVRGPENLRPVEVEHMCVRYNVSVDHMGQPRVKVEQKPDFASAQPGFTPAPPGGNVNSPPFN